MGWVAIIAVVSIGIFAAYWAAQVTGTDRTIVDRSSDVVSAVNTAESIRALLNPSVQQIAQRAAYDVGVNGARVSEWDSAKPDLATITETLTKEIRQRLPTGEDDTGGKNVLWESNSASITSTSDENFNLDGGIGFLVEDAAVNSRIRINHKFNMPIQSSFFKLAKVGRSLLENHEWIVSKSAIDSTKGNECKQKTSGQSGDTYTLTTSDFLRFAFQCGYESNSGLASLDKYDQTQSDALAGNIVNALESDLQMKYDLDFDIKPAIKSESGNSVVNLQIEIMDKTTLVSQDNGGDVLVDGKSVNVDFLRLKFNYNFNIDYSSSQPVVT